MIKFVILAVVGFILYKLITNDMRKKQDRIIQEKEKKAADGVMVKDPICGTYVDKDSDIRIKKSDGVLCFCSYDCRDKYLKSIGAEGSTDKD